MIRYAITDRIRSAGTESERRKELLRNAAAWAAEGVDFVQLREKDLEAGALADLARGIQAVFREQERHVGQRPKLLINSRADVAVAVEADGVHLTAQPGSLTPDDVRRLYAEVGLPEPVVSVSCHSLGDVVSARTAGASLILFGPVFEKVIADPEQPASAEALISYGTGINLLRTVCAAAGPVPVLGLGGITDKNAGACLEAGAAGIAAIRLFRGESLPLLPASGH